MSNGVLNWRLVSRVQTVILCFFYFCIYDDKVSAQLRGRNNRGTFTPDLTLFEEERGEGGSSLTYAENIGWFDNMDTLLEEVNIDSKQIKWICVESGVFIFYREPNFQASSPDDVRILSGLYACSAAPPMGIGSLRHDSNKWFDTKRSHISIFSGLYYSGMLYTVLKKSTRGIEKIQPTKSFITVGNQSWLVETDAGPFCVVTPSKNPETEAPTLFVCIVPNAAEFFNIKGTAQEDQSYTITSISRGCDVAAQELYVETCFDYRKGEMQLPAVDKLPPTTRDKTTTTKPTEPSGPEPSKTTDPGNKTSPFYGLECNDSSVYDELTLLLRLRITNDFDDQQQFLLPLDKKQVWRTELIDTTFEVAGELFGKFVYPSFLGIVREFFIYYSEKHSWSKGLAKPLEKPNAEVLTALHYVKDCLKKVENWKILETIQKAVEAVLASPFQQKDVIKAELLMKKAYDPLMEITWLTITIVGESCHQILGFKSDFWLDYFDVSGSMYLIPMVDFWLYSSDEQKYYPLVFGGINFTRQYEIAAVFGSTVYDTVKYANINVRPEELIKKRSFSAEIEVTATAAPLDTERRRKRQHKRPNRIALL